METIYFAGGCLWGVQAFIKTLNGVISTEAVSKCNGTRGKDCRITGRMRLPHMV